MFLAASQSKPNKKSNGRLKFIRGKIDTTREKQPPSKERSFQRKPKLAERQGSTRSLTAILKVNNFKRETVVVTDTIQESTTKRELSFEHDINFKSAEDKTESTEVADQLSTALVKTQQKATTTATSKPIFSTKQSSFKSSLKRAGSFVAPPRNTRDLEFGVHKRRAYLEYDVILTIDLPSKLSSVLPLTHLCNLKKFKMYPNSQSIIGSCIEDLLKHSFELPEKVQQSLIRCIKNHFYYLTFRVNDKKYVYDEINATKYFRHCVKNDMIPHLFVRFVHSYDKK